ncbi:MAG: ABC transporter permease [Anaerolineae bacterium]|nr:ABC transporter permease [Anaerolineae bacterium]
MSSQASTPNTISKIDATSEHYVSESLYQKGLRRLRRDRLSMIAFAVIIILALLSIFAPFITDNVLHVDPNKTDPMNNFLPFGTAGHLLGTDDVGRDQLARLLHAGRVSLGIGFFGAIITLTIGLTLGVMTGYFGGVVDDVMIWLITTLDSIPALYLLILIGAIFRPTAEALVFAIAIISWTGTTRLIRGQTIQIRNFDYITSARALGASPWRIMYSHIFPNLISVTTVALARFIGTLILTESSLSFLGLGVQPPTATWGNMLSKSQAFFKSGPHLVIFPGLLITITVLCLYVIGDGVRDAFDPQTND